MSAEDRRDLGIGDLVEALRRSEQNFRTIIERARPSHLCAAAVLLTGCGGTVSSSDARGDAGADVDAAAHADASLDVVAEASAEAEASPDSGSCRVSSDSTLPGVTIAFRAPVTCQFTLAQAQSGVAIPYDVIVAQDVSGVVPLPQDAGHCGTPGPSQLITFERLSGGGQDYCLCDIGLCAPSTPTPVTVRAGTYPSTFTWQGRNWGGPSDTSNPMGATFPAGTYVLHVDATGTRNGVSFQVNATLSIALTP